jgi:hypothetical protein
MVEDRALLLGAASNESVSTGGVLATAAEYIKEWRMYDSKVRMHGECLLCLRRPVVSR